jgi:hypothetical protein
MHSRAAPYSNLDPARSGSLEFTLTAKTFVIPGIKGEAKLSYKPEIPTAIRVWWNDWIPFGGVSKTLRRMWKAADSYKDISAISMRFGLDLRSSSEITQPTE